MEREHQIVFPLDRIEALNGIIWHWTRWIALIALILQFCIAAAMLERSIPLVLVANYVLYRRTFSFARFERSLIDSITLSAIPPPSNCCTASCFVCILCIAMACSSIILIRPWCIASCFACNAVVCSCIAFIKFCCISTWRRKILANSEKLLSMCALSAAIWSVAWVHGRQNVSTVDAPDGWDW